MDQGETGRRKWAVWAVDFGNSPRMEPEIITAGGWEVLSGALHFFNVDKVTDVLTTVLLLAPGTWKAMYLAGKSDE